MTLVLLLALDILLYVFNGVVLKVLWGWFIVPQFQLPTLSVASAIGISILIGFVTNHAFPEEVEMNERIKRTIAHNTATPLTALLAGWITHFFL